jgi:hypothetical protein
MFILKKLQGRYFFRRVSLTTFFFIIVVILYRIATSVVIPVFAATYKN